VEDAVVRELREETGLVARAGPLVGVYSAPERDPRKHTASVVFEMRGRPRAPSGGDDAASAAWVPLALAKGLAFDHDQILEDALARRSGDLARLRRSKSE
jgi:8-oxo-dGTP diphosphatase